MEKKPDNEIRTTRFMFDGVADGENVGMTVKSSWTPQGGDKAIPHVHIVIHKEVTDRNTALSRRLGNLPKRMLPHSERGTDGKIRSADGGVAGHFIAAMELAQERAREAAARQEEKAMALTAEQIQRESQNRWISRLLDSASRNPSLAGRDLAMEIISGDRVSLEVEPRQAET